MTQKCPADDCLSLHPSEHSLAMHLYKSDDEMHAQWDDYDATLREVFSEDYALDTDAEPSATGGEPTVENDTEPVPNGPADPSDGDGGATVSDGPEPTTATARTDGGPSAVPNDWGDDVVEDDDSEEGPACPACGSEDYFDPSNLPDSILSKAPELAEADRACADCSTDKNGNLSESVEVYDV